MNIEANTANTQPPKRFPHEPKSEAQTLKAQANLRRLLWSWLIILANIILFAVITEKGLLQAVKDTPADAIGFILGCAIVLTPISAFLSFILWLIASSIRNPKQTEKTDYMSWVVVVHFLISGIMVYLGFS